ncbi:MAG: hypothetical protein RIR33_1060 [Pseudomonadota bacterium]
MTSGTGFESRDRAVLRERVKGALVVAGGAAMMVGLAVAAMAMLTSPDSWMMKAANQAIQDQQQAVATSYLIHHGQ